MSLKSLIKKKCINISKHNIFFRKTFRYLINKKRSVYYHLLTKNTIIDDKMVVFSSYMGRSYADSPKAIYERMQLMDEFKDYKFVWALKNPEDYDSAYFKRSLKVKYGTKEFYEYLGIAKYWVSNSRLPDHVEKKEGQVYVQCWHGTPLKKLGFDIEFDGILNTRKEIAFKYTVDPERYDYMLSPSRFASEKFRSAFHLDQIHEKDIIIEEGYPRNDFLFSYTDDDVERIKNELGIPENKKIILYAPTWRDNQHTTGVGYTYDLSVDFNKWKEMLGDEYIILFRPHYFIANSFDFGKFEGFIYDVSKIDDINECYIISDILITDYSSVFFDYANLKRPMFFYMYDLNEYSNHVRGFYIDLNELPGPVIQNESDLLNHLKKNNLIDYSKIKEFNKKFNYLDDSNASIRVINHIFSKYGIYK